MYNNELYHHGIKGQRWGIRRFQNKDGTLTKAGLDRRDKNIREKTNYYGDKNRRHIRDNNTEDYVLKKGTKITRWINANDAMEDVWDRDTSMPVRFFDSAKSLKKVGSESGDEYMKRRRRELGL